MLAKPYPVSSPTSLPLIPTELHCIQISALEVLGAILENRLQPDFCLRIIYFVECIISRVASVYTLRFVVIRRPSVIHGLTKLYSDLILVPLMIYLLQWSWSSTRKPA